MARRSGRAPTPSAKVRDEQQDVYDLALQQLRAAVVGAAPAPSQVGAVGAAGSSVTGPPVADGSTADATATAAAPASSTANAPRRRPTKSRTATNPAPGMTLTQHIHLHIDNANAQAVSHDPTKPASRSHKRKATVTTVTNNVSLTICQGSASKFDPPNHTGKDTKADDSEDSESARDRSSSSSSSSDEDSSGEESSDEHKDADASAQQPFKRVLNRSAHEPPRRPGQSMPVTASGSDPMTGQAPGGPHCGAGTRCVMSGCPVGSSHLCMMCRVPLHALCGSVFEDNEMNRICPQCRPLPGHSASLQHLPPSASSASAALSASDRSDLTSKSSVSQSAATRTERQVDPFWWVTYLDKTAKPRQLGGKRRRRRIPLPVKHAAVASYFQVGGSQVGFRPFVEKKKILPAQLDESCIREWVKTFGASIQACYIPPTARVVSGILNGSLKPSSRVRPASQPQLELFLLEYLSGLRANRVPVTRFRLVTAGMLFLQLSREGPTGSLTESSASSAPSVSETRLLLSDSKADVQPATATTVRRKKLGFSNGWWSRFKSRSGICYYRLHGEAGCVQVEDFRDEIAEVRRIVSEYPASSVFNTDETGLLYRQYPRKSWILSEERKTVRGSKATTEKSRITMAVTVNATGCLKLPILFIGKSVSPRCFSGKILPESGVYRAQPNAWMTSAIFCDYLLTVFIPFVKQNNIGRSLLIMDNADVHNFSTVQDQLDAAGVRVIFLPAGTTSIWQPLDQGILSHLKRGYKTRLLEVVASTMAAGITAPLSAGYGEGCLASGHQASVYDAITLATQAWTTMAPTVIANCWKKSTLIKLNAVSSAGDSTAASVPIERSTSISKESLRLLDLYV